MAKHELQSTAQQAADPLKGTALEDTRMGTWTSKHPAAATLLLAILCLASLCLILYFVLFSDFSSSADFIYNQF